MHYANRNAWGFQGDMGVRYAPIALTAFLLGACSGGGGGSSTITPGVTTGTTTGVVIGSYFRNARVCMDSNNNAVCEAGEPATVTDSAGQYTLAGAGSNVVAEIGVDTSQYNPDTNTSAPVSRKIVLRAPKEAPGVISLHSTAVVAEMESSALTFNDAVQKVANVLGVSNGKVLGDFNKEVDGVSKAILKSASAEGLSRIQLALASAKPTDDTRKLLFGATGALDKIRTVVVIYLENRSFDQLYGLFPGANGIGSAMASPVSYQQLDRDGLTALPKLPAVWNAGADLAWSFVGSLPNKPFRIDAVPGGVPGAGTSVPTPDFVHRFYQSQMQINGGKNNQFAAFSDAGGLTMGYYDGSAMKLWALARQYTLADNFFHGAFGGSFLNHFWLVCACSPIWPNPPASSISSVDTSGVRLALAANSPPGALSGVPAYVADANVTPKLADGNHYAINTTQPPYQPSYTPPPVGGDARLTDPTGGSTNLVPLPAQTLPTIGDTLTAKNVNWRWYAGGWKQALLYRTGNYNGVAPDFTPHHQPFNYFRRFDPTTPDGAAERAEHLRDYTDLLDDIQSANLPQVTFYKPPATLNQHPGSGDFDKADTHIADLVAKLQASPQWGNMLVVVTYDENGGIWDHVAPPKADMWGPGTRVPAIIISPYAKKGYVDSVAYDTTSIIKFLTRRFGLATLAGARKSVGDLSNSLDLSP
jgi:acid phosphatase